MTTRHPDIATRNTSALFVVDVQERFRPHIFRFEEMVASIQLLVRAARMLDVPVGLSEQYPQGLGVTIAELEEVLGPDTARFEKLEISSREAPGWESMPAAVRDREHIIVVGIETHVCVAQTTLDLLHAGKRVQVVADAVSSRDPWQREVALERLARAGATITSAEAVLFELLGCAGTDEFKQVQGLIKEHDARRREQLGVMT